MTRIIAGILHRIDWDRREAVIGGETFQLLAGVPVSRDLVSGTGVIALVVARDGGSRLVHLRPNVAPRFVARAS